MIVMKLKSEYALRPDGFVAFFYQHYWEIIIFDILNIVNHFFLRDWILPHYNANTIVLIPKTNKAHKLNHFRHIALANFKHKIITKIMVDRLPTIIPFLISPKKKGYVNGRNIRGSICLTYEAINLLNYKTFGGNIALKIDIYKVFDTLSWTFTLKTLDCFGFNSMF